MRRYVASNGSWRRLRARARLPVIVLVGAMLGVGGWIAHANWSNQDPNEFVPLTKATKGDMNPPVWEPAQTSAAAPVAAPEMAALPPLPAPAKAETSGSNPSATAVGPNKAVAPPKPKEPSVLAAMQAQIAQMKSALKLTRDQEPYWPPVEALLHDIARQQAKLHPAAAHTGANGKPIKMIIHDADMQRLTSVAFPLLMTLREDQRRDALRLAQAMGFETVGAY
ncbi:MAG: hypothetical protein ACLPKB_16955 [Xanthobacteraceae bacterium]